MEKTTMVRIIRVLEFIGELKDQFQRPLVVMYSDKADSLLSLKQKLDNNIKTKQHLKLTQSGLIFREGSSLFIEIHKHFKRPTILRSKRASQGDLLCQANIKFDDLWDHLASEAQRETNSNLQVKFTNTISGLNLWIVAEAYGSDLRALDAQIKSAAEGLESFKPVLSRLGPANAGAGMLIEFGKAISGLNSAAQIVVNCIEVAYKHFEAQEESHAAMQDLAESMSNLAGQLDRLEKVQKSDKLRSIIGKFPGMMEEVVDFIEQWLKSWSAKHILVVPQKDKAIELRKKLDAFARNLEGHLLIEIRTEQDIMTKNAKMVADKKELDVLVSALGENKLPLREPCMEGTRTAILQDIENKIKNVDGPNMIWIKGSPGVGKSAIAASIAARLREQDRHVISFRFDRTQSTINTDALWRAVTLGLARHYPSVRQHILNIVQNDKMPEPSDKNGRFKFLIEMPLSTLNDVPCEELPVIVIDALDECGGLRHDSSGKDDYKGLLRMLERWGQADYLKRFKLVLTSRPDDRTTFPDSISICDIPSGQGVTLGDSVSNDIRVFLKSRLDTMKMNPAWVAKSLDYLVPGAAGIFIWATTVANFIEDNPEVRFDIIKSRKRGDDKEEMDDLYSLYTTVVETSFGRISKQEVQGIISVMGAMIYAKQPLSDDMLVMLPGVKIGKSDVMRLIRTGLMSVIDSNVILHFHHKSFEDYLLSASFLRELPEFSAVQDQDHHERQLAVLCLKTLVSSKLHFNMCNLASSTIKNVDISATVESTIPPLVSYSSQFWADHLVHTPFNEPSDKKLMEVVKFVIYEKLLFWIETMSLLGKAYEASLILKRALSWKSLDPNHELTLFIHDALRFISAFIIPISECAPQVYLSALPFAPEESHVARKFCSRFPETLVITQGKPDQWPMVMFTAEHHRNFVWDVVFSLDESTFVSISGSPDRRFETIYVCDSETGHCISGPCQLPHLGIGRNVCSSPDGKRILLEFDSDIVVWDIEMGKEQFRIKDSDFVFIHHDGKIASTHWVDEGASDESEDKGVSDDSENESAPDDSEDEGSTRLLVELWDANDGALISNRLLEVNDVAVTQFSPDGRFLAVGRKSEDVIELWSLEVWGDPQRFLYPPGKLSSLNFSPTSDTLMAVFEEHIYFWRLDTQEMVSFSHDFCYAIHVIHSPLTNYLFVERSFTVEIWDVSVTGSKMIWETKPPATSYVRSICPSRDGRRLLIGHDDGRVRMWNVDLEDSTGNRADTRDTQDDTDMRQVITVSNSGKMVITKLQKSHNIEILDTTTGEVIARTDIKYENDMKIAFSSDEEQVAFLSSSFIIIWDIMHLEKRVSFNPWPKEVWSWKVAFQTCNDLVICAVCDDKSGSLQVWHRQDSAGFKCTYSLDIKAEELSHPLSYPALGPDGLTVIFISSSESSPTKCYSWNYDTTQFDPVRFDDQVHIRRHSSFAGPGRPEYSHDGKLLAYWSPDDSHVRVWDTRTGRLVSKFTTPEVAGIALSPSVIDHPPGDRLIALRLKGNSKIGLFYAYTGHLYGQILGQDPANMAFIQDGTTFAYYYSDIGLRTWKVADLTAEHRHPTPECELKIRGMTNGWVIGQDGEPLFWVPVEHRKDLCVPPFRVVIEAPQILTKLDLSNSRFSSKWAECIDKGWLRELEQKEKEVGNLLE